MTNLDQFPQGQPLEIKKATGPLSIDNLSQTNDLATFKNWIDDYKSDILQKKTLQEVTDFLKVNPMLKWKTADGANAFVFGWSVYVMTDSIDFEESLKNVQTHIDAANKEISGSEVMKNAEIAAAAAKAKEEEQKLKDEVNKKQDNQDWKKNDKDKAGEENVDKNDSNDDGKDESKDEKSNDKKDDAGAEDKAEKETEKAPTSTKSVESMTDAEKVNSLKNTLMSLDRAMAEKKVFVDPTSGKPTIDLTTYEYEQFLLVQNLTEKANNGQQDDGEEYSRDMTRRERRRARKKLERKLDDAKQKNADMKDIAALEEMIAKEENDVNYYTNRANITHGINEVLKTGKYLNTTINYQPRAPLFMNICQSLNSMVKYGQINVSLAWYPNVLVRCKEKLLLNHVGDTVTDAMADNSAAAYEASGRSPNILETFLADNTKMSPEQAKRNASILTTGAVGAALFFGIKWLVKWGGESDKSSFWGRAAIVGWSLFWLNLASQWLTGRWAGDIIKDLRSGKLSFSDLMDGKTGLSTTETGHVTAASYALSGIPYGTLCNCAKEWQGGAAIIDFATLEQQLQTAIATEKDATQKEFREKKLLYVQELHKDPKWQELLNKALTDLGVDYKKLSDTKNANNTIDAKADEYQKRQIALADYKLTGMRLVNEKDADVLAYLSTGKPTLDELKKAMPAKFTRDVNAEQSLATAESKASITEPALKNIELSTASVLQNALNRVNSTVDNASGPNRPKFKNDAEWHLFLSSYAFDMPISQLENGNYKVGTLALPFADPEQALRVANTLNFLIVAWKSGWNTDTPYYADQDGDITVGDSITKPYGTGWLLNWINADDMKKKFFNSTAIDGNDLKSVPFASFESTLKSIGGITAWGIWGTQILVDHLNNMKNKNGESIWNKSTKTPIMWYKDIKNSMTDIKVYPKPKVEAPTTQNTNPNWSETPAPITTNPETWNNAINKDKRWVTEAFRNSGSANIEKSLRKNYVDVNGIKGISWLSASEQNEFISLWAKAIADSKEEFTIDIAGTWKIFVRQRGANAPKEKTQ